MRRPLPAEVARLADELAALPGAVAVALGGSRATGTHRPDSDWDLGVYYRPSAQPLDPGDVRQLGYSGIVSDLGEWGPIVHGGAWLTVGDTSVDVLFRDLDRIERWREDAEEGRFEVLAQNGHLVGAPTYLPVGELAVCHPISGELPRPGFPAALAASAPERWQGRARVALMFAESHGRLGDGVGCVGMLAAAVLCAAHGRLAARQEWALNEKRLAERAGLGAVQALLAAPGETSADLGRTAAAVAEALGVKPLAAR